MKYKWVLQTNTHIIQEVVQLLEQDRNFSASDVQPNTFMVRSNFISILLSQAERQSQFRDKAVKPAPSFLPFVLETWL